MVQGASGADQARCCLDIQMSRPWEREPSRLADRWKGTREELPASLPLDGETTVKVGDYPPLPGVGPAAVPA